MLRKILCLTMLSLLLATTKAEAYIDLGTGSMIVQAILAVLAFAGIFWRNVLSFFKRFFKKEKNEPQ